MLIWDISIFIYIIFQMWIIPIYVCFSSYKIVHNFKIFSGIFEPFFFCEILICFNTSYFSEGIYIKNKSKILKNYFKSDFILDTLPFLIQIITAFYQKYYYFDFFIIIRVLKMKRISEKINEEIDLSEKYQYILKLAKLLHHILYIAQFCGCIWFLFADYRIKIGFNDTWINKHNLVDEDLYIFLSLNAKKIICLFFYFFKI